MADIIERLKVAIADRYVIERELGQGGMATVYLGQDLKHNRKVALKVLRPELAAALGQFVEGESLRARLARDRQLSVEDALSIAEEIGEALE